MAYVLMKQLAWGGIGAGDGGKDVETMEDTDQGGQACGDGQLHWRTRATRIKAAEDHLDYHVGIKFGSVFICSVQ